MMALRSDILELLEGDVPRQPASPINVDGDYFSPHLCDAPSKFQVNGLFGGSSKGATTITAIAKEFKESKTHELMGLVYNAVPVVLVTTKSWKGVPLMFDGMHYIYEGRLIDVQGDKNNRSFTMHLKYPERKSPVCIQFTTHDVVSLLPRHAQRNRSEECSYFHMRGHCAFGLNCVKAHDPRKLSDKVKESLRNGDINILNESQQHTLHIAVVPEGMEEEEMHSLFEAFGPLKSVKVEAGKNLLQGQGWRIGFVTFHNARDAIKAKKVLNEHPKSVFRGVVQFSKQATKMHGIVTAHSQPEKQLLLPRQSINPRLDRATEQLYLHRISQHSVTTGEDIRQHLADHSLTSYLDITVSPTGEYGLVLFDSVEECETACHTLLAARPRQWALDYHPVEDRAHLKIRYLRWQALRKQEANHVKFIGSHWHSNPDTSPEAQMDRDDLYEQLSILHNEVGEADQHLTKLVIQAAQQACIQMKRDGICMDILYIGAAIGPDAVAFAEEKAGGLREFLDSQWQTAGFFYSEEDVSAAPAPRGRGQPLRSPFVKMVPELYCVPLPHVEIARKLPIGAHEVIC